MKLRTVVRDALYLNWALPAERVPPPPPPLRYELHSADGREWVFASALLFRQEGLHLPLLPFLRFSYPQLNLRLYVIDGDGRPAVLFRAMLVPAWVTPAARLLGRQPAAAALFDYPRPSQEPEAEGWEWAVRRGHALRVRTRRAASATGEGPVLGGWESTVRYFRRRDRGYAEVGHKLRRVEAEHPPVAVWPLAAEVADAALLADCLPLTGVRRGVWPALHSTWLCPEMPLVFELGTVHRPELSARLPQAAASSRSRLRQSAGGERAGAGGSL